MLPDLNSETFRHAVAQELRAWHDFSDSADFPLLSLVSVRQNLHQADSNQPGARRLAITQLFDDCLKQLIKSHPKLAQLLTLRFQEGLTVNGTADRMRLRRDQVKHMQPRAIDALASVIHTRESALRNDRAAALLDQLPPKNYVELVNPEYAAQLAAQLNQTSAQLWIVVGIGGIGKTALAHELAQRFARSGHFSRAAWLRIDQQAGVLSPQQLLSAMWAKLFENEPSDNSVKALSSQIRAVLRDEPLLFIIDNLERAQDVDLVVSTLAPITGQSCILITSRARPEEQAGLFVHAVKVLSRESSFALLRNYGAEVGSADFSAASDDHLRPIYEKTGGNPLALRLVGGLATVLPLQDVLNDLTVAETESISQFYNYVYHRSWQTLQPDEKLCLEMMPLADERIGMSLENMKEVTDLSTDRLWKATHGLVRRSLLEVSGTTWERTYTIHRLTQSFLQTEIIGLDEEPDD